jgi:hypothetical protein
MRHLDADNLHYHTFHSKSQMPIKAVIRHFASDTPTEDASNVLVTVGFSVVSVRQVTANRPLPHGDTQNISPHF